MLEQQSIIQLQNQGCRCDDWDKVTIAPYTDLSRIIRVNLSGDVTIGKLTAAGGGMIEDASLKNCVIGDEVFIHNIGEALINCNIEERARIENCGRILFHTDAPCGNGFTIDVLDESGSRPVTVFPGLSAQLALLMARMPRWTNQHLREILRTYIDNNPIPHIIGKGAKIRNCRLLQDVSVSPYSVVEGCQRLINGAIINNVGDTAGIAYCGYGVDAENFIIEDGHVDSGCILRNVYVGQGTKLEKGFSAHDSLFFANCALENGEACALFAGPYTVSMHKSTLLIGCQTSFMNAGSGSNQSNHMYKMGPVHWGILERGVKTSSDSYLMLGAKIGAFSLLMGQHKTHPDSSQFPFSYLFGDDRGATVVVPAVMLRSCGLLRDEKKWPVRDHRTSLPKPYNDRIIFDVLNPLTVDTMLSALDVIDKLLERPADDDRYLRYRGMKFTRASLERAKQIYKLAIYKYLDIHTRRNGFPVTEPGRTPAEWLDLAGLLLPRNLLDHALRQESIKAIEGALDKAFRHYRNLERAWIATRFNAKWRKPAEVIRAYAEEFDEMVDQDRKQYLDELAAENDMLKL